MAKTAWHDPDVHGRLLNALIKRANKEFYKALDEKNVELAQSWLDRIIKSEHGIRSYIEIVTGVKELIREGKKLEPNISV